VEKSMDSRYWSSPGRALIFIINPLEMSDFPLERLLTHAIVEKISETMAYMEQNRMLEPTLSQ
jgi:hypothetical protein